MSNHFCKYSRANPMLWYEMNYHVLEQLIPDLMTATIQQYEFECSNTCLQINLLEQNRYTQFVQVTQVFNSNQRILPTLKLNIRVYHDARLAEVVSCTGAGRLLPEYTYPNEKMLHKDEKRQANRLLYEWLNGARTYYRFQPTTQNIV